MSALQPGQVRKLCLLVKDLVCARSLFTKPKIMDKKFNVCIEGNIGSGKTTFLEYFRRFDRIVEINEEPVKVWRDFGGVNPLAILYEDPARWSCTFQSLVQLTLLGMHQKHQERPVRLMERSLFSSQYCFVENLYNNGHLTSYEYAVLSDWFGWIVRTHDLKIDLIVYLRTSPNTCWERIQYRNRKEEQNISLQYLQDLNKLHESWLMKDDNSNLPNTRVVVIDGDHDIQTMEETYRQLKSKILFDCERNTNPA